MKLRFKHTPMAVVPACTVLRAMEPVCSRAIWCDRAFCDSRNTVLVTCVVLSESMPMYAGTVVLKVVVDGDFERIAPAGTDRLARVLAIH